MAVTVVATVGGIMSLTFVAAAVGGDNMVVTV
jgi:hypothetical protein